MESEYAFSVRKKNTVILDDIIVSKHDFMSPKGRNKTPKVNLCSFT